MTAFQLAVYDAQWPFRRQLELRPSIPRCFVISGDTSRVYLAATGPSVQAPSDDPVHAGVFAGAALRSTTDAAVSLSPRVVFEVDDFVVSYRGSLALDGVPSGVVNPYLWSRWDHSCVLDGRSVCASALLHLSNARITEIDATVGAHPDNLGDHQVGVLAMSTICHGDEVSTLYGRCPWMESPYGHSPLVVAAAMDFYDQLCTFSEFDGSSSVDSGSSDSSDLSISAVSAGSGFSAYESAVACLTCEFPVSVSVFSPEVTSALTLIAGLEALFASIDGSIIFSYDTGASLSICPGLMQLLDVVLLAVPISLGGISPGITVTHRGSLQFLPAHLGVCYYPASAQANLISVGHHQRCGVMYASVAHSQLLVADRGGVQLDLVTLGDNRLSMASLALVQSTWSAELYVHATVWTPVAPLVAAIAAVPDFSIADDFAVHSDIFGVLSTGASHQRVFLDSADAIVFEESPPVAFTSRTVQSPTPRFEHYIAERWAHCAQRVEHFRSELGVCLGYSRESPVPKSVPGKSRSGLNALSTPSSPSAMFRESSVAAAPPLFPVDNFSPVKSRRRGRPSVAPLVGSSVTVAASVPASLSHAVYVYEARVQNSLYSDSSVVAGDSSLVGAVPLSLSTQLDLEESLYMQQLGHDSSSFVPPAVSLVASGASEPFASLFGLQSVVTGSELVVAILEQPVGFSVSLSAVPVPGVVVSYVEGQCLPSMIVSSTCWMLSWCIQMTAEYSAAGAACKDIIFYRQLLSVLGWLLMSV